jgi:hypothetical protein
MHLPVKTFLDYLLRVLRRLPPRIPSAANFRLALAKLLGLFARLAGVCPCSTRRVKLFNVRRILNFLKDGEPNGSLLRAERVGDCIPLLIGEVIIRDGRHHRAADILLAELALIARHTLAISLARIHARAGLEALGELARKRTANHWEDRHRHKKNGK